MTEEAQAPESQEPQVATQTLEDIAAEFHIQPEVPSQAPMAPAEPKLAEPLVPMGMDPLDETSVKNYVEYNARSQAALKSQLQSVKSELDEYKHERNNAKVEAEIRSAVEKVSEVADIEDKDYLEYLLNKRHESDPTFKMIWDNRHTKPQALANALKTVGNEWKGRFDFKADPQLAENHRAANQSQQQSDSTSTPQYNNSAEEKLANAKSEAEKAAIWKQIKSGPY